MKSCIFEGQVRHARSVPVAHSFRYRVFYMYLDLDELPGLFAGRWLWSADRWAPARFRRADHLGDPEQPLKTSVQQLVREHTGKTPDGPIRLLTHLSYFGYCQNPVSFYYCFSADGETLETVVAEVTNTPWGERRCYVLPASDSIRQGKVLRFTPEKTMHVSPFIDMDVEYDWSFNRPGNNLKVFMAISKKDRRIFDASMTLEREEIRGASLARVLIQYPLMTTKVVVGIYWQALRLWVKRCPFYPHPSKRAAAPAK